MDENIDDLDISTQDQDTEQSDQGDTQEETVDEIKARLAKAEELAHNYKIRAEKAETRNKETKESPKPNVTSKTDKQDLSSKDLYALMEAKVPQEDLDDIVEYARFKKMTVADALKDNVAKSILAEKAENRKVSEATNTGVSRRNSGKVSDEALLANAQKGILPESDDEMSRLLDARYAAKKK